MVSDFTVIKNAAAATAHPVTKDAAAGQRFALFKSRSAPIVQMEQEVQQALTATVTTLTHQGEEAKQAIAAISAIYVDAQTQTAQALSAGQEVQKHLAETQQETPLSQAFHEVVTKRFLQRVIAVIDAKSAAIVQTMAPSQEGASDDH